MSQEHWPKPCSMVLMSRSIVPLATRQRTCSTSMGMSIPPQQQQHLSRGKYPTRPVTAATINTGSSEHDQHHTNHETTNCAVQASRSSRPVCHLQHN